jgi:type I restriction enzyme, S subunit
MELKPGYKMTEVGAIPEEWEIKRLEELGHWKGGGTPSMSNSNFWSNGTIYWASSGDIKTSKLAVTSNLITENAVKRSSTTFLKEEAVLIVTRSGILRKYLPVAKNITPVAINQDIKALIPNGKVIADFLLHILTERGSHILASCLKSGTTVESIEYNWLKKYLIPVPSVSEQNVIAAALSDVDELLTSLELMIAKERGLKQAAMQQLLTGKSRLPGFRGEWEMKKLKDVAPLQRGFDLPSPRLKEGIYPVVYSNGILNKHSSFMVNGPGVITGRSGTIGKVTYVEDRFWPHNTALWVTDFKKNSPKFIYYLYVSTKLERFSTGSGVPTLNRNDVHSYKITIPSDYAEQEAIANVLSDMDEEIVALEQKRDKLKAVKQGMMQELLTGKTRLV